MVLKPSAKGMPFNHFYTTRVDNMDFENMLHWMQKNLKMIYNSNMIEYIINPKIS